MTRILLVEDEEPLRRALALNLTARGYTVFEAPDGTTGLNLAATEDPEVVILDLGLPDIDGNDVIRALRSRSAVPIVVLSARTGSTDKVEALDRGADDYVSKPFDIDELLARLRAATRRLGEPPRDNHVFLGNVRVDINHTSVDRVADDGSVSNIHLTPNEWALLTKLLEKPGRLVPTRELLVCMRGTPDHTDPSYLRLYVSQLRRKIESDPSRPRHILNEPGMGYRLVP